MIGLDSKYGWELRGWKDMVFSFILLSPEEMKNPCALTGHGVTSQAFSPGVNQNPFSATSVSTLLRCVSQAELPRLSAAKGKLKDVVAALERLRNCEGDRLVVEELARVLAWSAVHDDRRDDATAADKVAKLRGPAREKGASKLAEASTAHLAFVAESKAEVRIDEVLGC